MARITEISVSLSETIPLKQYASLKPMISMKAVCEPEEADVKGATEELQTEAITVDEK